MQIEKQEFGLKPMNCPGHCLMFEHRVRSYRGELYYILGSSHYFLYKYIIILQTSEHEFSLTFSVIKCRLVMQPVTFYKQPFVA